MFKKKKFNLDDIDNYLQELDIKWVDRLAKNIHNNKYEVVKEVRQRLKIYIENEMNKQQTVATLQVDDDKFILEFHGQQINMSKDWKNYIAEKHPEVQVEC